MYIDSGIGLMGIRCIRNVVSLFHIIKQELEWRRKRGMLEGFDSLKTFRPIVAVGPEKPLGDQLMMADFFRMSLSIGLSWEKNGI